MLIFVSSLASFGPRTLFIALSIFIKLKLCLFKDPLKIRIYRTVRALVLRSQIGFESQYYYQIISTKTAAFIEKQSWRYPVASPTTRSFRQCRTSHKSEVKLLLILIRTILQAEYSSASKQFHFLAHALTLKPPNILGSKFVILFVKLINNS